MTDKTDKKVPIQEIDDAALDDVCGAVSAGSLPTSEALRTTRVKSVVDLSGYFAP